MEVYVFLEKSDLPTLASWQQAISGANFPVDLHSTFDPIRGSGFVPCRLGGSESGFEYFLGPTTGVTSSYPDLKGSVGSYDLVAAFVWGSKLDECAVALVAAGTLASTSSGLMYDPQEGETYDGTSALKHAREIYDQIVATTQDSPTLR